MPDTLPHAVKADADKSLLSLVPRCAIEAEGRVLGFGAKKYAPDNWRKGFTWRRLIDAALRHVYAVADGEDRDPETGELHTAHARCMLGFLHEHIERGLGTDDRYKPVQRVRFNVPEDRESPCSTTVGWQEPDVEAHTPGKVEQADPRQNSFTPKKPWTYWYLATPYSKYPQGHEAASTVACRAAAQLMLLGVRVFSPIAHSHPVSKHIHGVSNTDHEFWLRVDAPMMEAASGLLVYQGDGWVTSRGMQEEIQRFMTAGKPVVYWRPSEYAPLDTLRAAESH